MRWNMHKRWRCFIVSLLVLLFAACGKKAEGTDVSGEKTDLNTDTLKQESMKESKSGEEGKGFFSYDSGKIMSADEIIAEAENAHFLSGDADEESLYGGTELRLGTVAPAFVQSHSLEEFPVYEGDAEFFTPVSGDYLIGVFETNRTILYEFFSGGSLYSLKGRIVYASEEELLSANKEKDLKADEMNESGYTYHGNVLYYRMDEGSLFSVGFYTNKYDLLKIAASGYWDSYLYWFSMPYETEYQFYDPEGWAAAYADTEYKMPLDDIPQDSDQQNDPAQGGSTQDNDRQDDPAQGSSTQSGGNADSSEGHLTAKEAEELFRALMMPSSKTLEEYSGLFSDTYSEKTISAYYNAAFRLPEEFDYSELSIVLDEPGFAYVTLLSYTVPENYSPMDKIDNFLFGAPVSFDAAQEKWVVEDNDTFFSVYGDAYYSNILTDGAYDAYVSDRFFKRYGTPFDLNSPQIYRTVFAGRVLEAYCDADGNLYVTLYFSNDTDADVTVSTMDNLVLVSENGVVAEVGADINKTVSAHDYLYDTLQIPRDYLQIQNFSNITVREFIYTVQ